MVPTALWLITVKLEPVGCAADLASVAEQLGDSASLLARPFLLSLTHKSWCWGSFGALQRI